MSDADSNTIFSADEARALASVLDEIIPRSDDGKLPGAGEIGVVRHIERTVRQSPDLEPMIKQGLADADNLARSRNADCFAALSRPDKLEVLQQLGSLVSMLTFPTYLGYYQDPRVGEALGLGTHPPHPKGYEMEPNDLSLLDAVRKRPKFYRKC